MRGSTSWRMGNWRLRTKLLMVLLIPSLAALALGALRVSVDYSDAQSLGRSSEQVDLDAAAASVAHELQYERDLTSVYLASGGSVNRARVDKQRGAVDNAIGQFRDRIDETKQGPYPEVADPFAEAAGHLDRLRDLRAVADQKTYPPDASYRAYSDSVNSLLELGEQGITQINNPALVRQYLATNAMARAQEEQSTKRALLGEALQRGSFRSDGEQALLGADAELNAALSDFRKWATPEQAQRYDDTVAGQEVDTARTIEAAALVRARDDGSLGDLNYNADQWINTSSKAVNLTSEVGTSLREELRNAVNEQAAAARAEMFTAAGLVIGALVLAFAIALLVARSLLLPLRTLRRSALEVAEKRLPDAVESILRDPNPDVAARTNVQAIPVHTTEEIGRVARSFDAVHSQALRLASEQALLRNNVNDLFVNLARRSQTLVQRQLSLIDRLEQDEQDPDQLSSLFELDHLATRMRRNNENLLILGGTDLTRRMMRPVPLTEVVGAAVSEVEQYARIAVSDAPDLAVQGRVVNDFVHLLAELLENATVFSNPDTEVDVRTAYRRQELVLEIRDRGVGIDDEELAEINERLTQPPEVDVAVSRRMGLFVVGQLARRHNIRVQLHNNTDLEGGVTAVVHLSGEYVSQISPDGQHLPMPDIQRAQAEEQQRDPLTESGTHVGLAAAFGRGGVADRGFPEPTPDRPLPQATDENAADAATAFTPVNPVQNSVSHTVTNSGTGLPKREPRTASDTGSSETVEPEESTPEYSFQFSSDDTYGAADVPRWGEPAEQWPSEDDVSSVPESASSELFDGKCGVPPEMEGTADLFRSPFEAEKTARFARTTEDNGWPGGSGDPGADRRDTNGTAAAFQNGTSEKGRSPSVDDAPTERLPIYEAVLSQWFREDGGTLAEPSRGEDPVPDSGAVESPPAESASRDAVEDHQAEPQPASSTSDPGWGSADVGWQAAEALVQQTQQEQETTSAGLPKRVPKSHLVPGSAGRAPQASAPRKPATPRSADAVRGRMSNFQQGIRRGRHAKAEPVSTEQPNSNSSRHEEQE